MNAPSLRSWTGFAIISVLIYLFVLTQKEWVQMPYYRQKLKASEQMLLAIKTVQEEAQQRKVNMDSVNDPMETGFIGPDWTEITTDQGILDAKLATINPNFSAVVVDMLRQAGVKRGDKVALAVTGSMPALNIAAIIACETLGAQPVIISSLGASFFGATRPNFTYLDMESLLYRKKIIHHRSVASSLGGGADHGRGLTPLGRKLLEKAIKRNSAMNISQQTQNLDESIALRMKIYQKYAHGKRYAAYINVGGGLASLGSSINGALIEPGFHRRLPRHNYPRQGTMIRLGLEIPVIHLLRIDRIAREYGLPYPVKSIPSVGEGSVFARVRVDPVKAGVGALLIVLTLVMLVRMDWFYKQFLRKQQSDV